MRVGISNDVSAVFDSVLSRSNFTELSPIVLLMTGALTNREILIRDENIRISCRLPQLPRDNANPAEAAGRTAASRTARLSRCRLGRRSSLSQLNQRLTQRSCHPCRSACAFRLLFSQPGGRHYFKV